MTRKDGCKPGEFLKDGKCTSITNICKEISEHPLMIHPGQPIALYPVMGKGGYWIMAKVWRNESGYEPWENWRFSNEEDASHVCDTLNHSLGLTKDDVYDIVTSSMFRR